MDLKHHWILNALVQFTMESIHGASASIIQVIRILRSSIGLTQLPVFAGSNLLLLPSELNLIQWMNRVRAGALKKPRKRQFSSLRPMWSKSPARIRNLPRSPKNPLKGFRSQLKLLPPLLLSQKVSTLMIKSVNSYLLPN